MRAAFDAVANITGIGPGPHLALTFHALPGNKTTLFSIPLLSRAGFDFILTDSYTSIMSLGDDCFRLRRQHPPDPDDDTSHGSGFWYIDLSVSPDGSVTIANDRVPTQTALDTIDNIRHRISHPTNANAIHAAHEPTTPPALQRL